MSPTRRALFFLVLFAVMVGLPGSRAAAEGGESCGNAALIFELPFADSGSTEGSIDDVSTLPAACPGIFFSAVAGPDHVYLFTVGGAGTNDLTFTLEPLVPGYDPAIYILDTCGVATSCIAATDVATAGEMETIAAGIDFAPGIYALYVDSHFSQGAESAGAYSLTVAGTLPEPGAGVAAGAGVVALGLVRLSCRRRGDRPPST